MNGVSRMSTYELEFSEYIECHLKARSCLRGLFLDECFVLVAENLYLFDRFARFCAFVEGDVKLGLGL